jgi:hypothetical protein
MMERSTQSKAYSQEAKFTTELIQQQITQDNNTGFLFCPRCGSVTVNQNPGICHNCGYRFCPSCSD